MEKIARAVLDGYSPLKIKNFRILAPQNMRARVLSILIMIIFGVQPIASLMIGYLAHLAGTSNAILVNGAFMVLGALLLLIFRSDLRRWQAADLIS